jgi:hypothetical protein
MVILSFCENISLSGCIEQEPRPLDYKTWLAATLSVFLIGNKLNT